MPFEAAQQAMNLTKPTVGRASQCARASAFWPPISQQKLSFKGRASQVIADPLGGLASASTEHA